MLVDTQNKTFEQIQNEMDSNGYSFENRENFLAKNNLPCYIPENADNISEVESYQSLLSQTINFLKDKDTLLNFADSYDMEEIYYDHIEQMEEKDIDYNFQYNFIDSDIKDVNDMADKIISNFFEENDKWVFFNTYLDTYFG